MYNFAKKYVDNETHHKRAARNLCNQRVSDRRGKNRNFRYASMLINYALNERSVSHVY